MDETDSFFRNNHVVVRDGDGPIAVAAGDQVLARIDGYVLVPKERIKDMDRFLAELDQQEQTCTT